MKIYLRLSGISTSFGLIVLVYGFPLQCCRYLEHGSVFRTTGSTLMNQHSSRSHAIFTIIVEQRTLQEGASSNDVITAKFHLVILLTCLIQRTENPTVEVLHCSTLRSLLEHCCVLVRIKRYLKTYITICSKMLK